MSATTNRFELITLEKLQEIYDILSTSPPGAAVWGTITGTLSSQLDLQAALNAKLTANATIAPGTATKVTYDSKGLITGASSITNSDLPFGIDASKIGNGTVDDTEFEFLDGVTGYIQPQLNSKYDASNPAGYVTSAALSGYLTIASAIATYYPLTNPAGYTSNAGTVTSVQLAAGTGISLSGTNPITTSGTITVATSGVTINKQTVTDGTAVTGTTANTLTGSILIPANTVTTGDILYIKTRVRKTGTLGTLVTRMYVNTSAAIGGSLIATSATNAASTLYFQYTRTLAVKSATNTESMAGNFNVNPDDNSVSSTAVSASNIDWTQNQYIVVAVANSSTADSSRSSFIQVQINKA